MHVQTTLILLHLIIFIDEVVDCGRRGIVWGAGLPRASKPRLRAAFTPDQPVSIRASLSLTNLLSGYYVTSAGDQGSLRALPLEIQAHAKCIVLRQRIGISNLFSKEKIMKTWKVAVLQT